MKAKKTVLCAFLFLSITLHAQTDFKPGFIINNSNDTIYGMIDYRGSLLMGHTCTFKTSDNAITNYFPNDILGYRFIDGKYFVSREIEGQRVFLEYLIKGMLNIYHLRDKDGDHYFLDKEDVTLVKIPYEESIRHIENEEGYYGKDVYYQSRQHFGVLSHYMQDAPDIQKKIAAIKKPEHKSLIKLAENYHNMVCEDEQCIIYEKRTSVKIYIEPSFGIIKYKNSIISRFEDKFYFNGGILVNFNVPSINERIYLKTGLLLSNITHERVNYVYNPQEFKYEWVVYETYDRLLLKTPLHAEYLYPKGIIRPRLSAGVNFYLPSFSSTASISGGFNIKANESLFLSITSSAEFNLAGNAIDMKTYEINSKRPFFNLLSYSVNCGLFIKLK